MSIISIIIVPNYKSFCLTLLVNLAMCENNFVVTNEKDAAEHATMYKIAADNNNLI